jgi:glycosyltransferase involved in cell wall biosynthesis
MQHLTEWIRTPGRRREVLQNWLAIAPDRGTTVVLQESSLAGRTVFVYAGNMGVAQGMDILLALAEKLKDRRDIGFLFVGRGSEVPRLMTLTKDKRLDNVLFHEEVDPQEMTGLLAQCHVGLIALDPRHKTHNVPGKFLSYMRAGLPVLATLNAGNDLIDVIAKEQVGESYVGESSDDLRRLAESFCDHDLRKDMAARTRTLADRLYSPSAAVSQIVAAVAKST